jgi:hypothetical protein
VLDSYYLREERLFRELYNDARRGFVDVYSMDKNVYKNRCPRRAVIHSWSVAGFYGPLTLVGALGLRIWLISPRPLPEVADVEGVTVTHMSPAEAGPSVGSAHPVGCGCEDLNGPAPVMATRAGAPAGLTVATARRLRRLYDPEAAALAAVTVLLGRPAPEVVAAARVQVAGDACTVATAQGTIPAVPEYARALVRGWAGRCVLPQEWACDVVATYLTLRLEAAERHTGVGLIDPAVALLPPVAWHERSDPGTAQLAWLTRSQTLCRRSP